MDYVSFVIASLAHSTICTSLYMLKLFNCFTCSDCQGDRPRPLPNIPELKQAKDVTERTKNPAWDFDVSLTRPFCYFLVF